MQYCRIFINSCKNSIFSGMDEEDEEEEEKEEDNQRPIIQDSDKAGEEKSRQPSINPNKSKDRLMAT